MRPIYCTETQERIPIEFFSQGKAVWCKGLPYLKSAALRLGLHPDASPPNDIAHLFATPIPAPKAASAVPAQAGKAAAPPKAEVAPSKVGKPDDKENVASPVLKASNLNQVSAGAAVATDTPTVPPKKNTASVVPPGKIFARPDESTKVRANLVEMDEELPIVSAPANSTSTKAGTVPTLPPISCVSNAELPATSESDRLQQSVDFAKSLAAESKALADVKALDESRLLEEAKRLAEQSEVARQRAEEEEKTRRDAEAKRLEEEEMVRRMAEAKRRAEEIAKRAEEARRRAQEEEKAQQEAEAEVTLAAEAARLAAEAKKKAELEALRAAEAKKKAEEEERARILEEQRRKAAEAARLKAEEEERARILEEQRRKAAEEARLKAEEAERARILEEQRRKAAEEARLKAEEEERARVLEEQRRKAAEEARLKAEEEERARVLEEQRRKAAEETEKERLRLESEARKKAEGEEKLRQAEKAKADAEAARRDAAEAATTPRLIPVPAKATPEFEEPGATEIIPNVAEKIASQIKAPAQPAVSEPLQPGASCALPLPEDPKRAMKPENYPGANAKLDRGERLSGEALQEYSIFQNLPASQVLLCTGAVSRRTFKKGDLICREGDRGTTAFYMVSGRADVFVSTAMAQFKSEKEKKEVTRQGPLSFFRRFTTGIMSKAEIPKPTAPAAAKPDSGTTNLTYDYLIAQVYPQDLFGEMTCLSYSPRSATVRASEDCVVLELLCNAVQVLQKYQKLKPLALKAYRERALGPHLRSVPILADLDDKFIEILRDRIEFLEFAPGDVILKQDDPATAFYLIRSGCIKVSQPRLGGELVRGYLGRAEFFGEVGLLKSGKITATLTALDHTEIVKIKKADFEFMLNGHEGLRERFVEAIARREKANQLLADFGFWNVCGNPGEYNPMPPSQQ